MIYILLADGFEEIEALTPLDVLRRAGLQVRTVAVGSKIAIGSHGISVICDLTSTEVDLNEKIDMVILPGGMPGTLNLDKAEFTDRIINKALECGGRIAAICAAPLILGKRKLLMGKSAICYPGFEDQLTGANISEESVVTDGAITTAKGMGVALRFSKELVSLLVSPEKAEEIGKQVMED